jgi:hypothetical protein
LNATAMRAAAKRSARKAARRKPDAPQCESSVYDGSRLLGSLLPRDGKFVARDAGGRKLGKFADGRVGMRAICDADRAERPRAGLIDARIEPELTDAEISLSRVFARAGNSPEARGRHVPSA